MDACVLYVGTEDGVFVFLYEGVARLSRIGHGLAGNAVRGIAVHPHDSRIAYVACGLRGWGLHRTRNAGESFESLGFADQWVWDVVLDPIDPRMVYVGTEPPMLHVSRDEGETFSPFKGIDELPSRSRWHFFHPPFRDRPGQSGHVHGIAIHPSRPGRIFAAVEVGALIFTEDGGESWNETLVGEDAHRVAIDPSNPDRVFAAIGGGVLISPDTGRTWKPVPDLANKYIHVIRFDPSNPTRIYVGEAGTPPIYASEDGGSTWKPLGEELPSTGIGVDSVELHPNDPRVLFYGGALGEWTGRLFVSVDGGKSWKILAEELPKIRRLRASPWGE